MIMKKTVYIIFFFYSITSVIGQNQYIGKWSIINFNGKDVPLNDQKNELWNFFDYSSTGVLSIVDEYGNEKQLRGTGTLYGKFHGENMQGIWHFNNGKVLIVYSTPMLKALGANYEFEGTIQRGQNFLFLSGYLCTNMGDGCKNKAKLNLKFKKL